MDELRRKEIRKLLDEAKCDACGNDGNLLFDSQGEGRYWLCSTYSKHHGKSHYIGVLIQNPIPTALRECLDEIERLREPMHACAPEWMKCSDCTIDHEPCPICYQQWWRRKHPNVILCERDPDYKNAIASEKCL